MEESSLIRLQKWCSQQGLASRRECEQWILNGSILVNKRPATLGTKINPTTDEVRINGRVVTSQTLGKVYWVLNKPRAFLCSRKSQNDLPTIYDLPALKKIKFKIDSVGRLDYMSEGMLLLTNDGEMLHRLCHPSFKVKKHYQVLVDKKLTQADLNEFKRGIELDDGMADAEVLFANQVNMGQSKGYWYFVTISQGRKRIIRRMFEKKQCRVHRLRRYGIGELRLGKVKEGVVTQLTSDEISYLKSI